MNEIYLEDIYKLCISFVRNSKAQKEKCLRPQTFAVLEEYIDIDAANLNKTVREKGRPYFYSRSWEKSGFNKSKLDHEVPLLAIFPINVSVENPFQKVKCTRYEMDFIFLDQYHIEACEKGTKGCKGRTRHELYKDQKANLEKLFAFFDGCKYYTFTGGSIPNGLYHPSSVVKFKAADPNLVETIDDLGSRKWERMLRSNNKVIYDYWNGTARGLYGMACKLVFEIKGCETYEYNAEMNTITKCNDEYPFNG